MTSPFDTEHPYDIITRSRLDLEEYVLMVQVSPSHTHLSVSLSEHAQSNSVVVYCINHYLKTAVQQVKFSKCT